jgi:ABC-type bacteriocin/lantibiotic exporter with double-glycine peptidase domain
MGSDYSVQHVPQTQAMSCWAASTAMMIGYRDNQSYPESAVLQQFKDFGADGADEGECQQLAYRLGFTIVQNACRNAQGWAQMLERGPVMVGSPTHVIVIAGISGEDDDSHAQLKILDPAASGEQWGGYQAIEQQYELNPDAGYDSNLFQW